MAADDFVLARQHLVKGIHASSTRDHLPAGAVCPRQCHGDSARAILTPERENFAGEGEATEVEVDVCASAAQVGLAVQQERDLRWFKSPALRADLRGSAGDGQQ